VFWVAARKLELIEVGCERAFLFSTAMRVASDARPRHTGRSGNVIGVRWKYTVTSVCAGTFTPGRGASVTSRWCRRMVARNEPRCTGRR
jgi:hypothetical protein